MCESDSIPGPRELTCATGVTIKKKKCPRGIPWWLGMLRIQHCHGCGSGCCCGMGLTPGQGTFACPRHSQKNCLRNSNNLAYKLYLSDNFSLEGMIQKFILRASTSIFGWNNSLGLHIPENYMRRRFLSAPGNSSWKSSPEVTAGSFACMT